MLGCLILLGAASQPAGHNTFTEFSTSDKATWICRTADTFRSPEARLAETDTPGDLPYALITLDDLEDMLAPWIGIVAEDCDLVEVQFLVERYQRLRPTDGTSLRVDRR